MTLTVKQKAFVDHKIAGLNNSQAVIAAGYSATGAKQTAQGLLKHPKVKAALRGAAKKPAKIDADELTNKVMPRQKYDDPITFLEDLMNHPAMPVAVRADAAKQLLPYKHARIGETGKKESKVERAKNVVKGKFRPKSPPRQANVVPIR